MKQIIVTLTVFVAWTLMFTTKFNACNIKATEGT